MVCPCSVWRDFVGPNGLNSWWHMSSPLSYICQPTVRACWAFQLAGHPVGFEVSPDRCARRRGMSSSGAPRASRGVVRWKLLLGRCRRKTLKVETVECDLDFSMHRPTTSHKSRIWLEMIILLFIWGRVRGGNELQLLNRETRVPMKWLIFSSRIYFWKQNHNAHEAKFFFATWALAKATFSTWIGI